MIGYLKSLASLFLAEVMKATKRRAVRGIGGLAVGLLLMSSWTNNDLVQDSRDQIAQADAWATTIEREPGISREEVLRLRETLAESTDLHKTRIRVLEKEYSSSNLHKIVLTLFGTGPGIALSVLLAATLFGAEFRWGYWKTIATHQPARGRVILAKFCVMWMMLLVGLILVAVLAYPIYLVLGRLYGIHSNVTWPPVASLMPMLMKAWVTLVSYASLTAAAVVVFRASLAGIVVSVSFVMLDGLVSARIGFLKRLLPVQQVAELFGDASETFGVLSRVWFPPASLAANQIPLTFSPQDGELLAEPISSGLGVVVLLVWALMASLSAMYFMNRLDIPD